MPRPQQHEIPTHLNVEDKVLFGLTVRQVLYLMVGCSIAYGVWGQTVQLAEPIRLALPMALALVAIAFALLRPAGRPLEEWLVAAVCFLATPRVSTWQTRAVLADNWDALGGDWRELSPTLDWHQG
jgi:hypothetical protein